MYARVTLAQLQPGKVDEYFNFSCQGHVYQAAQATARVQKGLLLLTDETTNKGIAIALWETEAAMAASEASGGYYQVQIARGVHFFAAPPVRETYRVNIQV